MAAKQYDLLPTQPLSEVASVQLVKSLMSVRLTPARRHRLQEDAEAARKAFARGSFFGQNRA